MQRQISLLQQFVHACCGISSPSDQMVSDLMAPTLNEPQRLLGAVVRTVPPTPRLPSSPDAPLPAQQGAWTGCALFPRPAPPHVVV